MLYEFLLKLLPSFISKLTWFVGTQEHIAGLMRICLHRFKPLVVKQLMSSSSSVRVNYKHAVKEKPSFIR